VQWQLACEALLRQRYAMTGLDQREYRRLEALVFNVFDVPSSRAKAR
jgi:hypothetical protein